MHITVATWEGKISIGWVHLDLFFIESVTATEFFQVVSLRPVDSKHIQHQEARNFGQKVTVESMLGGNNGVDFIVGEHKLWGEIWEAVRFETQHQAQFSKFSMAGRSSV